MPTDDADVVIEFLDWVSRAEIGSRRAALEFEHRPLSARLAAPASAGGDEVSMMLARGGERVKAAADVEEQLARLVSAASAAAELACERLSTLLRSSSTCRVRP